MNIELKITPTDRGGFVIKTYDRDGDLRIPKETLVAKNLRDLTVIIATIYQPTNKA